MPSISTRILKNTFMLYTRHIIIIFINLYILRVVLNTLGAEDYGIYNVVGGVVVLFLFLNGAMTNATQRFLNYSLGQNNIEQARDVFSASLIFFLFIILFIIILAETLGLWLFYTWINIPSDRKSVAFVVYQFSIALTSINILRIPYHATIIAYEKMSTFALISIIEGILNLINALLLTIIKFDKLILYSFFVCITGIIVFFIYKIYCNKRFETAHFRYCKDKVLFRHLAEFSGWSVFGSLANAGSSQGINILANVFYGVTVNAAFGIATQVNSAVYNFVNNFQTAFSPQIIKSYAAKDYNFFMQLIFQTSKISFYLLFFFVLPLYINTNYVLFIWLKNVPEYTVIFTRLILLFSLVDAVACPLWLSIQATGDIKKYHIIISCFVFLNLPLSFLFLWLGFSPVWILIIKTGINVITLVWRILFLGKKIELPVIRFLREVIIPIILVSGISSLFTNILCYQLIDLHKLILSCIISTFSIIILIYFLGLNIIEKQYIKKWITNNIFQRNIINQ